MSKKGGFFGAGRGIGRALAEGLAQAGVAPVLFFCSEGASYVNGQNLYIDGGATTFGM